MTACPSCTAAETEYATRTVAASTASSTSQSRPRSVTQGRWGPGTVLAGRYQIIALLGKGGMGEVYRAEDLTLGQPVALKFLPEALIHNEDALRRFHNEVRLARQVSHPNVCRVHDVGEAEGQVFLSMEYADGEDLASLLRRIGHLPEAKALEIARKLCAGLAAAHERGVLHRDLKPANIMLDSHGQVLLTDFGLAGIADQIAGAEVRSGTPAYMAPEQLAGREVTVRSDIYSLGLVLYELFTGKRPYEGQTLADLVRERSEGTPASLSSHVRDLDPSIERVILRCLQPEPSRRPPSAIAVSAALPGGDPLAAALAAGETPSPQMVAAAGEGAGFSLRVAIPLFAIIVIALAGQVFLMHRSSAVETIGPRYSPDVLEHKAREIIRRAGYTADAADSERFFAFDESLLNHVERSDKPFPKWTEVLRRRPPVLRFRYRQSPAHLTGVEFHDDLLTPGVVTAGDPPQTLSGMKSVVVDAEGQLLDFRAIPEERQKNIAPNPPPADWGPLFEAAALDVSKLKPVNPERAWIEPADTRIAWTGEWPGSQRPLRVEAASWQGRPVVFTLEGPWTPAERTSEADSQPQYVFFLIVGLMVLTGGPLLARRNLQKGRGDRRGAFRIAMFMFTVHMLLWAARVHVTPSFGLAGMFLLALCTASFYALVVWSVYLAVEPFVRRHWPQTIVSLTRVLSGRIRDPIVGRDVMVGIALSLFWRAIGHAVAAREGVKSRPDFVSPEVLIGSRAALGECLESVPHAVREALIFVFLMLIFRVLLRNQWLAAGAFVALWTSLAVISGASPGAVLANALVYASIALVVLRFGLLAVAVTILFDGVLSEIPFTLNVSVWYFGQSLAMTLTVFAFVCWGFREAVRGQKISAFSLE